MLLRHATPLRNLPAIQRRGLLCSKSLGKLATVWLHTASKPKMRAVGACMRKLLMVCYGVLKNRAPFDPAWSSRITP